MSDDLVTNAILDSSGFGRGADDVAARARRLEGEVGGSAERIVERMAGIGEEISGGIIGGLGLASLASGIEKNVEGAVEGTVEMVHRQLESLTELSHLSERTGIAVNSLKALQFEAKATGTDFQTLQNDIKKMSVNIGEAIEGGPKAKIFEQLGLDPRELAALAPDRSFLAIADSIRSLENPVSRVHMAFEIFGKSGAEALNVIMAGSDGMSDALDKVGDVTQDQIEQAERWHKATVELDAATDKLARRLSTELAPGATAALKAAMPLVDKLGLGLGVVLGADFGKGGAFGTDGQQTATADAARAAAENAAARRAAEEQFADEAKSQKLDEEYGKEFGRDEDRANKLVEQSSPQAKFNRELGDIAGLSEGGHLDPLELQDALTDAAKRFSDEMDKNDPIRKLKKEAEHLFDEADPERKLHDKFAKIKEMLDKGVVDQDQAEELVNKASDDFGRSQGLGELLDGKEHAKQRVEGAGAVEDESKAYEAFFKNLQPNVDTEAKRQTELQRKLVDANAVIQAQLQQINQKTTTPTVVSM